jgi:hypothetical protein
MSKRENPPPAGGADVRIQTAAARYVRARAERNRLTRERNAIDCERTAPTPDESWNVGGRPAIPVGPFQKHPCWRATYESSDCGYTGGWEVYGDGLPDGWCAACERRAKLHAERVAAIREVVAAFNSLRFAVAAAGSVTPESVAALPVLTKRAP